MSTELREEAKDPEMSNPPFLWAAVARSLPELRTSEGRFSAWLHFDRPWDDRDRAGILNLIQQGLQALMISGRFAHAIQETVDDLVAHAISDPVLTTSRTQLDRNTAVEFSSIRGAEGAPTMFLVSACSNEIASEVMFMQQQLYLMAAEIAVNIAPDIGENRDSELISSRCGRRDAEGPARRLRTR